MEVRVASGDGLIKLPGFLSARRMDGLEGVIYMLPALLSAARAYSVPGNLRPELVLEGLE